MLMLYRSADRYLKPGGRLGMVVTQTLFQTKGAGDGFRRFRLGPDGDWLRVDRVDDLAALKPFPGAANRTSTIVLTKGGQTEYPVPYVKWTPGPDGGCPRQSRCSARPIDPERPGSPWSIGLGGHRTSRRSRCTAAAGPSDYTAHLGANSGGANAVYWLRLLGKSTGRRRRPCWCENLAAKAKRRAGRCEQVIEPDLLYPLLRWGDVRRWSARPSAHILLAQDADTRSGIDEAVMRREYPRTLPVFATVRGVARPAGPPTAATRGGSRSIRCTTSARTRWRRSRWCGGGWSGPIHAAVVEPIDDPLLGRRPVVPQETCVLIACASADEAHYLCAVLNSAPARRWSSRRTASAAARVLARPACWIISACGVSTPATGGIGLGRVQPPGART